MTFFYISYVAQKEGINVEFNWQRGKLFDKYITSTIYEYVMENNLGIITSIETKDVTKFKPYPLTTVDF